MDCSGIDRAEHPPIEKPFAPSSDRKQASRRLQCLSGSEGRTAELLKKVMAAKENALAEGQITGEEQVGMPDRPRRVWGEDLAGAR